VKMARRKRLAPKYKNACAIEDAACKSSMRRGECPYRHHPLLGRVLWAHERHQEMQHMCSRVQRHTGESSVPTMLRNIACGYCGTSCTGVIVFLPRGEESIYKYSHAKNC
jgi:hypothetical protein